MTAQALRSIGGVAPKLQDHHLRRQAIVYGVPVVLEQ
jgi:hypothetical protein